MNLKIIEINAFDKVILCETGLVISFEILDIGVQPDWFAEVELIAYFL